MSEASKTEKPLFDSKSLSNSAAKVATDFFVNMIRRIPIVGDAIVGFLGIDKLAEGGAEKIAVAIEPMIGGGIEKAIEASKNVMPKGESKQADKPVVPLDTPPAKIASSGIEKTGRRSS